MDWIESYSSFDSSHNWKKKWQNGWWSLPGFYWVLVWFLFFLLLKSSGIDGRMIEFAEMIFTLKKEFQTTIETIWQRFEIEKWKKLPKRIFFLVISQRHPKFSWNSMGRLDLEFETAVMILLDLIIDLIFFYWTLDKGPIFLWIGRTAQRFFFLKKKSKESARDIEWKKTKYEKKEEMRQEKRRRDWTKKNEKKRVAGRWSSSSFPFSAPLSLNISRVIIPLPSTVKPGN